MELKQDLWDIFYSNLDTLFEECNQCGKCSSGCDCAHSECACMSSCAVGAISRDKKIKIDDEKCIDCGACVFSCPNKALELI